jgi:hypothetical protein
MAIVFASSVIPAAAADVWPLVRNFNGLPDWHPMIAQSRIEQGKAPDQIGCIRNFSLHDGGVIREQLLSLSDYDFSVTYSILESPMPLQNYVATLRLHPITDSNRTFAEWQAQFDCNKADETELVSSISNDVFQGGFNALKQRFA